MQLQRQGHHTFSSSTLLGRGLSVGHRTARCSRGRLSVTAVKRAVKKKQLVLLEDVDKLGTKGDLVTVAMGYWRNYLMPYRKAKAATPDILAQIQAEQDAVEKAKQEVKDQAMKLATALRTIGKFVIKKKAGDTGSIFGSVTAQEVAEAVYQQTGQALDKREITLPEIKELGAYDASVKLHPEVVGKFKVIVTQEKNLPGRK